MALSPDVPATLHEAEDLAATFRQSCAHLPGALTHGSFLTTWLAPLFACSSYLSDQCLQNPERLFAVLDGAIESASDHDRSPNLFLAGQTEEAAMSVLRGYRHEQMLRIICRDLLGYATLVDTLRDLSDLAEHCIQQAEQFAHNQLVKRFGEPVDSEGVNQRLIILGMGKLGGRELNFSSDVDLILIYPCSGNTLGPRKIDNGEFFRKLAQMLVKLLSTITADGFVFRVDLRLRPFGDSGPLVINFEGAENYYLTQGREWERYAMIKARPVSHECDASRELMELLNPFIYRRYLDYSAFESLRDLKRRIAAQVVQKGMQSNIKLGPGGIREIEFIGQAFQLVRGGREPELKSRSILKILGLLRKKGLLEDSDVACLERAYDFLRRTENYLQMLRDQQTHALPENAVDRVRLCYAMGFDSWMQFAEVLDGHRMKVQEQFKALFQTEGDDTADILHEYAALWMPEQTEEYSTVSSIEWLLQHGYEQPETVVSTLEELASGAFYRNLTTRSQKRVDKLVPRILQVVEEQQGSSLAFQGLIKLLRAVAGRSVYLQILFETPAALQLLARLFSRSTWIAEFVCQHPIVIDELLDHRHLDAPVSQTSLQQEIGFVRERIFEEDLDVQMDAMRQFRQAATMRLAVAELEGKLDLMRVSDGLSWIAEASLQAVSDLVWDQLVARHGKPRCRIDGERVSPGFAIVAYGKLGGLELGYASDLDLVFLHDSDGEEQLTDGERPLENPVFFARFAQKIVHFISTLTPAGVLYETDMRLRPNGQSGMLVSNVSAFEHYQLNEAWIWEHQALVRARVVVGNDRLRRRFSITRHRVLSLDRDVLSLRQEVADMRERMRGELGSGDSPLFDLKQDKGGIADIEFMVQYMVLWKSAEFDELTTDTDNFRILECVERFGLLEAAQASQLREAYLDFRREVHKLALLENKARTTLSDTLAHHRDNVTKIWRELMTADATIKAENS